MNKEEVTNAIMAIEEAEFRDLITRAKTDMPLKETVIDGQLMTNLHDGVEFCKRLVAVCPKGKGQPFCTASKGYRIVQFQDAWLPYVEVPEDLFGDVIYHEGRGMATIFYKDDNFKMGDNHIGVVLVNSFTKETGVDIQFKVLLPDNKTLSIPRKIAKFHNVHVGKNVSVNIKDFSEMLIKIRSAWSTMFKHFTEYEVTPENFDDIIKKFDCDERVLKPIKENTMSGAHYTLWDLSMAIYDTLLKKEYKSDLHKQERLDNFTETIFGYTFMMQLGGN